MYLFIIKKDFMKNKNKQRREKKTKRLKHPSLGRTKAIIKNPYTSRKIKQPPKQCSICNVSYKNIKVMYIGMINHICKCNNYLIDEAIKRLRKQRIEKRIKK